MQTDAQQFSHLAHLAHLGTLQRQNVLHAALYNNQLTHLCAARVPTGFTQLHLIWSPSHSIWSPSPWTAPNWN